MFADIKNQVIVEAGEKREASPLQKRESTMQQKKSNPRKDK